MKQENKLVFNEIQYQLKSNVDEEYKIGSSNYFKEPIMLYGVRIPIVRKIARVVSKNTLDWDLEDIFEISDNLVRTGIAENFCVGVELVFRRKEELKKENFYFFESWLFDIVRDWSKVDDLCPKIFSFYIENFPEFKKDIMDWSKSDFLYVRRASLVSFIKLCNQKKYLEDVLFLVNFLKFDDEDLIHKAMGWLLRETWYFFPNEIYSFLMENKKDLPRVTIRYAVERMSIEDKNNVMVKDWDS